MVLQKIISEAFTRFRTQTPAWARRLGNALLGAGTVVASIAYISDYPEVALGAAVVAGVGKFALEFFKEEETECDSQK